MLPLLAGSLFLIAAGAGVLAVAWQSYRAGAVPAGPNFLKGRWLPSRDDNPLAFHFFVGLYFVGGMALCVWGLLALLGMAPPLRLQ